jgi:RNA polymerase sigma factor (sigma-70 family)
MSVPDGPSRTQDEWIALRCQAGDNTGFEDLVALMERPLLYYAAKLTGNAQTAYDVLQDVWVKVFSGIRGLKNPASLRPWLYRITHGLAVDRIRQHVSRERAEEAHMDGLQESTIVVRPRAFDTRAFATLNVVQPPTCRYRSARPNLDYLRVADYSPLNAADRAYGNHYN